ncbi:hypothetical protein LTS12_028897 [Elasticomyces elasticus]|nr:hypothetical protein LTS12_028897 [Elasticomyces elasticus]
MGYKTNFEPYVSECCSMGIERERTSEVLYPLLTLYPHVTVLQMQSNPAALANSDYFPCYQNVSYWADAYSNQCSEEESKASSCRSSRPYQFPPHTI